MRHSLFVSLDVLPAGVKLNFQIETQSQAGAILVAKHNIYREDQIQGLERMKKYMRDNYETWMGFAAENDHDTVRSYEDLIFVTGHDLTADFALLAFAQVQHTFSAEFHVGASVGAELSAHAAAWGLWKLQQPAFQHIGPQPRTASDSLQHHSSNAEPTFAQCVFLRGIKIKKRLLPTRLYAAAVGHNSGPPPGRQDGPDEYEHPPPYDSIVRSPANTSAGNSGREASPAEPDPTVETDGTEVCSFTVPNALSCTQLSILSLCRIFLTMSPNTYLMYVKYLSSSLQRSL